MKKLLFFFLMAFPNLIYCQRLQVEFVNGNYFSNIEVSSPYSVEGTHNHVYWRYSYFHNIKKNQELGLGVSFSTPMVGFTLAGYPNQSFLSSASGSGNLLSIYFQYSYNLRILKNMYINCNAGMNFSKYFVYFLNSDRLVVFSVANVEEFRSYKHYKGYPGLMVLPEISIGLKYNFLSTFCIEARLGYTQGTQRIQEYENVYSIYGGKQYYSKNYSYGSNYYPSIGLSYYFCGYSKNWKNEEEKKPVDTPRRKKRVYK